jgi:hypothetical protein
VAIAHPTGASELSVDRLTFDRRVRLEFHGSKISSDGGLLLFRELDDVLDLYALAGEHLTDTRTGHNRLHGVVTLSAISLIVAIEQQAMSLKSHASAFAVVGNLRSI